LSVTAGVAVFAPVTFTTTVSPPAVNAFPLTSREVTVIVVTLPAVPLGTLAVVCPAFAGPGVTLIALDVAEASPVLVKTNVRSPTVPVIDRSVNVATPLAFVVTDVVPFNVPPPVLIAASTLTPLWLTGFPLLSCSWSTGCCPNTTVSRPTAAS
jgi:hypothetical protein